VPELDHAPIQASAPVATTFRHEPALDGLRGLAVLAIIAFHLDYSWARGAFLGVDLFFVLSGFLITTLLITEWRRADTIVLPAFWGRRARRLLPALLLVLILVAIFTRLEIDPWNRAAIRGDGIASLFYVANWRFIAVNQGYFGLFSAPSPLRHMWSLAIEEQFYLVWPLVVYAVLRATRGSLRVLGAVCGIGVGASIVAMAVAAALVVMVYAWSTATGTSARYYRGGSAAYAVLASVVIAGALQPGVLRRALAFRPLAWIGRLSYGLYLFHWPLIVWLVPARVHIHGFALNALRLVLTFVAATISFFLVELPVRERRRPVLPWHHADASDPNRRAPHGHVTRWLALPSIAITLAIVLASNTGATAAPSYLSGSQTPTFSFPTPPIAPARATGTPTSTISPATSYPTITQPKFNYVWSYGDPLFCGTPRSSETDEAVAEARRLGPPPRARSAAGLRILVLGDSTACSLFPGVKAVGDEVGAGVAQASVFGCGVASGEITTTRGEQITPHTERCPAMVDAALLPAIDIMRPDVVIWMSIWEKSDVIAGGRTLVSGTPAADAEMLRRMDAALTRITAYGAKVVLLTVPAPAPNDAQGASNTSNAVDDASYARLDRIDRRFAQRHPGSVTLVDLAHQLCPSGPPCPEKVDGLRMRPDGRHFTPTAASIEARWLLPQIVAAAGS
jgi:peptidoglycan/LPS O-acetylase OafA/YrhL/lysophospholipase L1-like esterase